MATWSRSAGSDGGGVRDVAGVRPGAGEAAAEEEEPAANPPKGGR